VLQSRICIFLVQNFFALSFVEATVRMYILFLAMDRHGRGSSRTSLRVAAVARYLDSLAVQCAHHIASGRQLPQTPAYVVRGRHRSSICNDAAWIPFAGCPTSTPFNPEPGGVRTQQQGLLRIQAAAVAQDSLAVASDALKAYRFVAERAVATGAWEHPGRREFELPSRTTR
jgi:hypothetical protein